MDNTKLAERLRQFAESQRMDFYYPSTAAMLEDAAGALENAGTELTEERRAKVNLQAGLTRAHKVRDKIRAERNTLAAALEAAEAELTDLRANPRDEYHTMDELYDYRMLYNALAFNAWAAAQTFPVVKSWRHSDGELCFGGGWFIVTATLPTGLVSNHYKAEHWDLFQVHDVWYPPKYDGHTPQDAAERLRSVAAAPVSLEAAKAETKTEWAQADAGRSGVPVAVVQQLHDAGWAYVLNLAGVPAWIQPSPAAVSTLRRRPVSGAGDDRG